MNVKEQFKRNSVKDCLLRSLVLSGQFILNNWIFILPFIAIGAAGFLAATYAKVFPSLNTWLHINFQFREASAWGQLGDFIGGLLNPLISLFTLLIAALVWKLQKLELAETREAIKDQTFDQFFMSVLASHRAMSEQVSNIHPSTRETLLTGKGAIDLYCTKLTGYKQPFSTKIEREKILYTSDPGRYSASSFIINVTDSLQKEFEVWKFPLEETMPMFSFFCVHYYAKTLSIANPLDSIARPENLILGNERFENIFGHIFRSTYQILKLIDEQFSKPEDRKIASRYVNLLRAQMSKSEFVFFALSALTKEGKKSWARSVRLDFFQGRLQNSDWTKSLSSVFKADEDNIKLANEILKGDEYAD